MKKCFAVLGLDSYRTPKISMIGLIITYVCAIENYGRGNNIRNVKESYKVLLNEIKKIPFYKTKFLIEVITFKDFIWIIKNVWWFFCTNIFWKRWHGFVNKSMRRCIVFWRERRQFFLKLFEKKMWNSTEINFELTLLKYTVK